MSTIPAAIDALVAAAERAWPKVQVLDGGPTIEVRDDTIAIGYSGSSEDVDVRSTMTQEQLETQPDLERYEVMCLLSAFSGSAHRNGRPDAKSTRDRAFELLRGIGRELARDPDLGGAVGLARMATVDVMADQTPMGPVCTIRFVVSVAAFSVA